MRRGEIRSSTFPTVDESQAGQSIRFGAARVEVGERVEVLQTRSARGDAEIFLLTPNVSMGRAEFDNRVVVRVRNEVLSATGGRPDELRVDFIKMRSVVKNNQGAVARSSPLAEKSFIVSESGLRRTDGRPITEDERAALEARYRNFSELLPIQTAICGQALRVGDIVSAGELDTSAIASLDPATAALGLIQPAIDVQLLQTRDHEAGTVASFGGKGRETIEMPTERGSDIVATLSHKVQFLVAIDRCQVIEHRSIFSLDAEVTRNGGDSGRRIAFEFRVQADYSAESMPGPANQSHAS